MYKNKIFIYISLFFFNFLSAGDIASSFTKINNDVIINRSAPITIISKKINLSKIQNVLVVADGSFLPYIKQGKGQVIIKVDGKTSTSNRSIIDWRNAKVHLPHAFNCISAIKLNKGTHVIKLIAFVDIETPNTNFKIGKGSGMSILVDAAPNMILSSPEDPSQIINLDTSKKGGLSPLPEVNVMTNKINVGSNPVSVVSLASGTSRRECGDGDALWGIFLNKEDCINNGKSQWSVQDLLAEAEIEAPMFLHSYHTLVGDNDISLKASELSFTYFENAVCYKINKDSKLVSLYGMKFSGKAEIRNTYCNREEWGFFGSTSKNAKYYREIGVPYPVLTKEINIPDDHNGIVLFLAKFRLQAGPNNDEGEASLWINIDGTDIGTISFQGFKKPHSDSSRTISASYLSAGDKRLAPGKHTVTVYLKSEGRFEQIANSFDLPLVYFD